MLDIFYAAWKIVKYTVLHCYASLVQIVKFGLIKAHLRSFVLFSAHL